LCRVIVPPVAFSVACGGVPWFVDLLAIGGDWWEAELILRIPTWDIWRGEFFSEKTSFFHHDDSP
jgi:hypothetical protein